MDLYSIDVSALGDTVWVTGDDGSCVGRFSKRFGIDLHRTVTEQMAGAAQCLHCTHDAAGAVECREFLEAIRRHYGIEVPADIISF
ncbi:hypothetical protein [Paraburkholderia phytofirmans]|uniref:Uncharacterized protein n=1 Tax=Paraburkholderia phytofirmans TaxID=261302 RepID=A0ABW9BHB5_9BURK